MRTLGLSASILAVAQILTLTSPALAEETTKPAEAASPAEPPKPAEPATSPPPGGAGSGMVQMHIDASRPVTLARRPAGATRFENVCVSPCDEAVPADGEYQIVGSDLNPSKPFLLDTSKGKVVLSVSPGTLQKEKIGLYTLIGSGVLIVGGALVAILGSNAKTNANGEIPQSNTGTIYVGELMMVAGVGGGIFGGAWFLDNRNTGVNGDVGKTIPEKSTPAPNGGQIKLSGMPSFVTIPLYTGTF